MPVRRVLLVLVVVLAAACSRTGMLYDNADWLAYRWADGLIGAGEVQEKVWRDLFRDAMSDHRDRLLPDIVALLQSLETGIRDGMVDDRIVCWQLVLDDLYREHARWAATPAAAVLTDLSTSQVDRLADELADRNREYIETYLDDDPDERQRNRVARYVDRIEQWTGDLDTAQLRVVEALVRELPDTAPGWLAYRQSRQRQLLRLLRDGASVTEMRRFVEDWWVELDGRPPALIAQTVAVQDGVTELILSLDRMLTREQRDEVIERVADLRAGLQAAVAAERSVSSTGKGVDQCSGRGPHT